MKNGLVKMMTLAGTLVLAAGSLAGCGDNSNTAANASNASTNSAAASSTAGSSAANDTEAGAAADSSTASADLRGSILLAGSTSMEKVANALCEAFMEKYPNVTASAEFTGSSAGVEAVLAGSADIGDSSRNLKDEEKQKGAVENIIAIDGIAVCVDPANTVEDLTKDQLIGIYDGTVTNWQDLGGTDAPIIVVGREAGSGTRGAFEELLGLEDKCAYANELDSTGAVMAKVASTPGAIGYVSLDVLDDSVNAFPWKAWSPLLRISKQDSIS